MKFDRPRIILACVILAAVATSAFGKEEWRKVTSANFMLVGNASEKEMRQVATKLEQFRYSFSLIFPNARLASGIPTNVVVFRSASAYKPFKPKRPDGKPDEGILGYFQPGDDVNYITLSTEGEMKDVYGTIFHEYVHAMLNATFGRAEVPPWFNEGLAEFYQTYRVEDDQKIYLGDLQQGHLDLLQSTKLIPLKQLFAVDNYSLHANGNHSRSIFYAEAWALIHYLIQSNHGANAGKLGQFLARVMNNEDAEKAFAETFGMDYAAMEKALTKYVEQRSFAGTVVTLNKKMVFDDQMTAAPVDEAQANAYLGDLLYHTREYADAETYLAKALALAPKLSMAQTSLGLVKMRQRNYLEARKHLELATADDESNYFAQYSYAYILSRGSIDEFGYSTGFPAEDLQKMQKALDRSVQLNPGYPESHYLRAWIELVSGNDLESGLNALRKAMMLQPGRDEYRMLLAQFYLKKQQFEPARTVVEKLARSASNDGMRKQAGQMLEQINKYTEAKQAVEDARKNATTIDGRKPMFLKRSTLSDADLAKIERDREIRNINIALGAPPEGNRRLLGHITKVECKDNDVVYSFESNDGPINLTSPDFQSLQLQILREGTNDIAVGCDADISGELIVADFEPIEPAPPKLKRANEKANARPTSGKLRSISFVPSDFRLMTRADIENAPTVIVEGMPPTDTAANERLIEQEKAKFMQRRREMMMQQIVSSLRKPLDGEVRMMGTIDKVVCSGKKISVQITTGGAAMTLRSPEPKDIALKVYRPDTGGLRFGCGTSFPGLKALITYRPDPEKKGKYLGDLVAVEFVPDSFELPTAN